jgi:hypothetical protein
MPCSTLVTADAALLVNGKLVNGTGMCSAYGTLFVFPGFCTCTLQQHHAYRYHACEAEAFLALQLSTVLLLQCEAYHSMAISDLLCNPMLLWLVHEA